MPGNAEQQRSGQHDARIDHPCQSAVSPDRHLTNSPNRSIIAARSEVE
jgi:hypothetical protein